MRKISVVIILSLLISAFAGCDKKRVFDDYKAVDGEWHKDSIISFDLGELDSLQTYNLFINLRNNNDFRYSNLFLITEIRFPQGKVITDTLEYEMAAPSGEWLGKGFGDVKENKFWYKGNVRFDEPGDYQVDIKHAMRKNGEVNGIDNLEGITHVGFRIENTSE
ncbi:gliding motility lipoprotein GldH [Salegentibacter sp.]|uniref:gliding motility lipoprotein GldH n=1 Tax=Salegentibacter sp. TaxID=1903072 RepID=UPI0035649CDB